MIISPLAGALSDKTGRRPVMVTGLALLTVGFTWVAVKGSLTTSWVELTLALLVAGVGISMALPTVPTAVLSAVAPHEMGKASGINYMAQRLGGVFAIAISTAVFTANGHLGTPASVTAGFKPALAACAVLALLGTLSAIAITSRRDESIPEPEPGARELSIADRAGTRSS
jgi:MFS family permease